MQQKDNVSLVTRSQGIELSKNDRGSRINDTGANIEMIGSVQ